MTKFSDINTEGYTEAELAVLNGAYEAIVSAVSPEFEADTHAVSDSVCDSFRPGDTVETLVARALAEHPSFNA